MKLTDEQIAEFDENGFLVFPGLFSQDEIDVLSEETQRLATLDTPEVLRTGDLYTIYQFHEDHGPTASRAYHAAARSPRLLQPAMQVLREDKLYIYNSKLNCKKALTGAVMLWHQDSGYWRLDRVPGSNMATFMIALGDVEAVSGNLFVIPGSHKLGPLPHMPDTTTTYQKQFSVVRDRLIEVLRDSPPPVALEGEAGFGAILHANLIHGSSHNLSRTDRWQAYLAYNPVSNRPSEFKTGRPEYMKSTNYTPLVVGQDDDILEAAGAVTA